jgi:TonB family protein
MRFKLPGQDEAIEAQARIVWMSESKKEAGVQFEQLRAGDARKISDWILAEQGFDTRLGEAVSDAAAALISAPASEPSHPQETAERPSPASVKYEAPPPPPTVWAASEERETGFVDFPQMSVSQPAKLSPKHRWATPAAILALIAFVSFGTGVLIERRLQYGQSNPAQPTAAQPTEPPKQAKEQSPDNAPPSALAESEKASSENAGMQGGIATKPVPGSSNASTPASEPSSMMPGPVPTKVDQRNNKGSERPEAADLTAREAPNSDTSKVLASQVDKPKPLDSSRQDTRGKDSALKPARAFSNIGSAPSLDGTDRSAASSPSPERKSPPTAVPMSASVQSVNAEASPQNQTKISQEAAPPSANEKAASPVPAAPAPSVTKPLAPSITISIPPFPSMRIPPELKSRASRAGTTLQMGQLVTRTQPDYPADAVQKGIAGTVKVHATIGQDGAVQSLEANGPDLLAEAAMNAVRQWRYKPTLLDGQAIEAEEEIVIVFRLSPSNK